MRIVFLNSMEKNGGMPGINEIIGGAKVWIGEEEGTWRMGWNETTSEGEEEMLWYEGASWSEMLHIYRYKLVMKLSEGYRPVIEGVWDEGGQLQQRGMFSQRLVCYSEYHENEPLYAELSSWRRKKASTLRRPPYLIASNRLLRLISVFCPRTMEELLELPGVGTSKAEEFGEELLEMTKDRDRPGNFPLHWVRDEINDEMLRTWLYKQKEIKYKQEMDKFSLRRNVLTALAEGLDIEGICKQANIERRDAIELLEQLDREGYSVERLIQMELQEVSKEEQDTIWKAYEELGDALLKPILHRVYGTETVEGRELDKLYEHLRLIRIQFRQHVVNVATRKAV